MKKILLTLVMLVSATSLFAANEVASDSTVIDLGTFTGITAFVSFAITQIAKSISAIGSKRWAKILSSIGVGVIVTLVAWFLGTAQFLTGLNVWQVLLYGAGTGLSGCGFYDIVKPILDRIGSKKHNDQE